MFSRSYFPLYFTPGYFGHQPAHVDTSPVEDAGHGIGVEFEGTNYPFVQPSNDIRGILADFWLGHYLTNAVGPFRITAVYGAGNVPLGTLGGPSHTLDVVVKDANNLTVCDTRTALSYRGVYFGNRFFIHEWIFADRTCRAVQHTKISTNNPISLDATITPVNGILDERTNELMPARVLSIQVGDEILSGDIVFQSGWNMEIAQDPISGHGSSRLDLSGLIDTTGAVVVNETSLQFSAVAGAGDGVFPGCIPEDEIGLRRINNIPPTDTGDFRLNGEQCIFVAPPYLLGDPTRIIPFALQIGNHCGQCRPCDNYVDAYRELRDIYTNLNSIAGRAERDRNTFRTLVNDVQDVADNCTKSITGNVSGGLDYRATSISVSVQITNNTQACYKNVTLSVSMSFPGGAPYIAHSGGFKTYDSGKSEPWYDASFPSLTTTWDEISPGTSVRIHFVLIWLPDPPASGPTGTFTLSATATCDAGSIPVGKTAETLTISEAIS